MNFFNNYIYLNHIKYFKLNFATVVSEHTHVYTYSACFPLDLIYLV